MWWLPSDTRCPPRDAAKLTLWAVLIVALGSVSLEHSMPFRNSRQMKPFPSPALSITPNKQKGLLASIHNQMLLLLALLTRTAAQLARVSAFSF
ncbi:hypothetical protein I79_026153 [Cricetulus griseus]|uniref:Uncharacterized protein n=1 Tax=Cricetulus griseus TaxID=10029 RepID=G3IQ60_CRIGR|nr:hypothetical protein I79_026153 [Cricetulus griseus]